MLALPGDNRHLFAGFELPAAEFPGCILCIALNRDCFISLLLPLPADHVRAYDGGRGQRLGIDGDQEDPTTG